VPASDRDRSDLLYISRPHDGLVYVAERSCKGSQKLLWSLIPREPFGPEFRVDAADVPREIRRKPIAISLVDRLSTTSLDLQEVILPLPSSAIRVQPLRA